MFFSRRFYIRILTSLSENFLYIETKPRDTPQAGKPCYYIGDNCYVIYPMIFLDWQQGILEAKRK